MNKKARAIFCALITLTDGRKIEGVFNRDANNIITSIREVVEVATIEDDVILYFEKSTEFGFDAFPLWLSKKSGKFFVKKA